MQVTGQNVKPKAVTQPQYNSSYNCGNCACPTAHPATQQPVQQAQSQSMPPQQVYYPTQYQQVQYQPQQPTQNYQVPATASGVNIQIFNPSVSTPGAQPPTYNVNAPCYPANYYTGQIGQGVGGAGQGVGGSGQNGNSGNINNGTNNGTIGNNNNNTTNTTNNNTTTTSTEEKKKTEKKKIVQLTDDYIRNLENYLNSQDKEVRLNAAKEVYARLEEDESRKDDRALTALINKMLQDPMTEVRMLALAALDGRLVTGDDFTVGVLNKMQSSKDGFGQDAVDASKILLKMSGKEVEKEVPVKENKKTTSEKTQTKESK